MAQICFFMYTGKSQAIPGKVAGVCRFCGTTSNTGVLAVGNVCADPDCQVIMLANDYV